MSERKCFAPTLLVALLALASLTTTARQAAAQTVIPYNPSDYTTMADADNKPENTIPLGTVIDIHNWQKYQRFMPVGMRTLFSGKLFYHLGDGPDWQIKVGPAEKLAYPDKWYANTEKYAGQAKLVRNPEGGYVMTGWVAGWPFGTKIDPSDPLAGIKVAYNARSSWKPFIKKTPQLLIHLIDRYGGDRYQVDDVGTWYPHGVSDPGYDFLNGPTGDYVMTANRHFLTAPEQAKYTMQLSVLFVDPSKFNDVFSYLPSLRRALHLSATSVCAPSVGADLFLDDSNTGFQWLAPHFDVKLLGIKRILTQTPHVSHARNSPEGYSMVNPFPAFVNIKSGLYQLRDVYVIDVAPIHALTGPYCYNHKVLFVDKQIQGGTFFDDYDSVNNYWKYWYQPLFMDPMPWGQECYNGSASAQLSSDLQFFHSTVAFNTVVSKYDNQAPPEYQNVQVMSSPSSLSQNMR